MVGITMMSVIATTIVCGFRHRPHNMLNLRKSQLMMSAYIPRSELRFGQSLDTKTLAEVVNSVAFSISITDLSSHLDRTDKPAFEWFERFLSELPAEDDEHFELNVMNKLISAHTSLFEYQTTSAVNPDVSLNFSHAVEPCLLAGLLLDAKKAVLRGKVDSSTLISVFTT